MSCNVKINKSTLAAEIQSLLKELSVSHKLVLATCKAVAKEHLVLRFNFDSESFEVLPLAPFRLNNTLI